MKGKIIFYHPEETMEYHIKKCFCKVVFLNNQNTLVVEIESDDDLNHVDEDSLQNEYPQVSLTIEDFIINEKSNKQLIGKKYIIPAFEERVNQYDETEDIFFTNLNVNDELDLETNDNEVKFGNDEKGKMKMLWTGKCSNFFDDNDEMLKFKISCIFSEDKVEIIED